jgi:hypothetical protein
VQWARTPPSASWRFDSGRDRPRGDRAGGRERSPRRRSTSPRRERDGASPRREDRRERDYDRRDRERSRSPNGDREMKDVRDREEDRPDRERDDRRDREAIGNGEERKSEHSDPDYDDLI